MSGMRLALILVSATAFVLAADKPSSDPAGQKALDHLRAADRARRAEQTARLHYAELQLAIKRRDAEAERDARAKVAADRAAGLHPEAPANREAEMDAVVASLDCTQAIIEIHNRRFPSDPWDGVADLASMVAGDLTPARKAAGDACAKRLLGEAGR